MVLRSLKKWFLTTPVATADSMTGVEHFAEVLQQMTLPAALLEGPEHRFVFTNKTYDDTFALGTGPRGRTIMEVFGPALDPKFKKSLDHIYRTGEAFSGKESFFARPNRDGSVSNHYLDFTCAAKRSVDGQIEGVLIVIVDVTERVNAQLVMTESEMKFRTLADSMPQIVWTANPDGKLDYFNRVWFQYSGTSFAENTGDGWARAVHQDDLARTVKSWTHSVETGEVYENEFRLRNHQGEYRWHVARALPERSAAGTIIKWYGTNTDIHKTKLLAHQLENAKRSIEGEQQKFGTIFADSATSMAVLQGADFVYEIANSSYLALFDGRDIIGKPFLVALPELVGQAFPRHAQEVFETGVPYIDREAKAYLSRSTGGPLEERYFDQTYTRMLDQYGEAYGVFIHAREVTDLVFARREIEEAAERYRIAMDLANMGTWELIPATGLVRWSGRTQELFGASMLDNFPLEKALARIHPEDRERVTGAINQAIDPLSEGQYSIDYRVVQDDGSVRWLSVLGQSFHAETPEGKITSRFAGNVLDITERVSSEAMLKEAAESAERASTAKSQFLANMSHEIRTPLGAIMGFASLLKDQTLGRYEHESFVSVIERNSTQLLRIIDDILDLSKVEAGMMVIEDIKFSLPELLTDFSSLMGFKAREKGVTFLSQATTSLPKEIITDPTRLRQILMNVVGNAIKFTDQGQVELRISFGENQLTFEVEDTGRGISEQQAENLFQPFAQADSSITRKYGGTGLGLVLSRTLAEAMGGEFTLVRSELGKGSVFSVTVRAHLSPGTEFVSGLGFETEPIRTVKAAGQLSGLKVLLVEDSPDNQALISIFLGRAGASTDIASDGAQGVRMARMEMHEIVLMDVQMPVMDGLTAIKQLRASGYDRPVIALTAHAMKEEKQRCLQAGFTDFLSKPVSRDDLIEVLLKHRNSQV